MRIGVNCGHTMSGTVGSGATGILDESTETRAVGYALMDSLRGYGYEVVDCTDDMAETVSENLREICAIANSQPLDMFISIHLDSSDYKSASGCSAYYFKPYSGTLASSVAYSLSATVKGGTGKTLPNRGAHFYPFKVIRIENCPAILVECGFISNSSDFSVQNSATGRSCIARGIYNGIMAYFNS